jgi:ATP-dependent DNA ligase
MPRDPKLALDERQSSGPGVSPSDPGEMLGVAPMEATLVSELPHPPGWQYEPKWDGFRAIVMRCGTAVEIWSKSGKALGRYFPELVEQIRHLGVERFVVDGELVVPIADHLSFGALQARLHPAASRVAKLSRETPAQLILFDCLRIGDLDYSGRPLAVRRTALERLHSKIGNASLVLSPMARDRRQAEHWLSSSGGALDGVVAKRLEQPYLAGVRAMVKVKQLRTADCIVGGYRKTTGGGVASLLLGLFNDEGRLDLVGFSSGFSAARRLELAATLESRGVGPGFTGRAPGGPSRWSPNRSVDYIRLVHDLVVEVVYDQVTAGRFRHGARFLRWRPDKAPDQCTYEQLAPELNPAELLQLVDQLE